MSGEPNVSRWAEGWWLFTGKAHRHQETAGGSTQTAFMHIKQDQEEQLVYKKMYFQKYMRWAVLIKS